MKKIFLAQRMTVGGQPIEGPLQGINNIADLINRILPFLITTAGIILFFVFIWGGYDFITSQGNAEKIKSAQAKITTGIIGFILLIISYLLVRVVTRIFGLGEGIF